MWVTPINTRQVNQTFVYLIVSIIKTTGAEEYAATPCDPGYYCPLGTTSATQYPCPAGTYYNLTMARDTMDCLPCPGGDYCATDGLAYPTGKCSQGM